MAGGPMTVIVVIVLAGLLVAGLLAVYRGRSARTSGRRAKVCQRCRNINPLHAKFCSQCGEPLDS